MEQADVTLKDIAKTIGKSVATVSKALNDHSDISPETRTTIKRLAAEMGYRPNITARRLQKQRAEAIGLVLPVLSARHADPFFTELLAGVADQAAAQEFDLLVQAIPPGEKEKNAYQRLVNQRRVDGFIITQLRQQDWRLNFLTTQDIPFVAVDHHAPNLTCPGIWIDTFNGIKQAIDHAREQGKNNIALIPPPQNLVFSQTYITAFETVVAQYDDISGQVGQTIADLSQKEGYRAAQMLLGANSPEALIACHDLVALGAITAIQDQGFEIGSDIIVIGFGDILLAEHSNPPLTSLHQPTYDMGQKACQLLINQIIGKQALPEPEIIKPWLVVRQSSSLALWL